MKTIISAKFFLLIALALPWAAASFAKEAPERREFVIEEPVFQGKARISQAGIGNTKTIVLVHGLGEGATKVWEPLLPWLTQEYHVLSFDLPGFGGSSKANIVYSPEKYVSFIKFVTQKYASGPFVLMGHSMGGAIALRYAATFPDDVERLVVADAAGVLHRAAYSHYLSHLGINLLPVFYPMQKENLKSLAGVALGRIERLNLNPEAILHSAALRESVLSSDPAKIAGLALVLDDFSGLVPRVTSRTLVIWGKEDNVAPVRTGRMLAAVLPDARLVVIDRAAHVPMVEEAAAFQQTLQAFLLTTESGTAAIDGGAQAAGKPKEGRCEGKRDMTFRGEYSHLLLYRCTGTRIVNARVQELRVVDSTVDIEDSVIGGGKIGLSVDRSKVTMTGGRIEAAVAVSAIESRLDFAGVRIKATEVAVRAPLESSAVFSISEIDSPRTKGTVHGYYVITQDKPL